MNISTKNDSFHHQQSFCISHLLFMMMMLVRMKMMMMIRSSPFMLRLKFTSSPSTKHQGAHQNKVNLSATLPSPSLSLPSLLLSLPSLSLSSQSLLCSSSPMHCTDSSMSSPPHRVAEVAREHGWHPPKSLDSDENFKPEHTLFCRKLRFVAIYALFFGDLWA